MKRKELAEVVINFIPNLNRRIFRIFPRPDMPRQQLGLLHTLSHHGNMPMKVFSKKMHISKSNLTKLVNQLIDEGLVFRTHSEQDRRIILLDITEEGKKVMKSHYEMMIKELTKTFDIYDEEEIDELSYHFKEIDRLISKIDINSCDNEKGNIC